MSGDKSRDTISGNEMLGVKNSGYYVKMQDTGQSLSLISCFMLRFKN